MNVATARTNNTKPNLVKHTHTHTRMHMELNPQLSKQRLSKDHCYFYLEERKLEERERESSSRLVQQREENHYELTN